MQDNLINNKEISFTEDKIFTREQVESLFLSVHWISGNYPEMLYRALMNSSTVITAWDHDRLIGLARVLDDGAMMAYVHYVLVNPAYHGHGIAGHMIEMIKEKYRNYLYIEGMPEESKNVPFYEHHGFRVMEDAVPIQIVNLDFADKS
jgi:GNAT superfamily N-acetyltransferase